MADVSGREAWAGAKTLHDLAVLSALYVEGRNAYHPEHGGPVDEETALVVPVLAAVNRRGFMTTCSQPAVALGDGYAQRAFVTGYCSEELAEALAHGLATTDLVCWWTVPGAMDIGLRVPVTHNDGFTHTSLGGPADPDSIVTWYRESCRREAIEAVLTAPQMTIFDPVWGRPRLLWDTLVQVLALDPSLTAGI